MSAWVCPDCNGPIDDAGNCWCDQALLGKWEFPETEY